MVLAPLLWFKVQGPIQRPVQLVRYQDFSALHQQLRLYVVLLHFLEPVLIHLDYARPFVGNAWPASFLWLSDRDLLFVLRFIGFFIALVFLAVAGRTRVVVVVVVVDNGVARRAQFPQAAQPPPPASAAARAAEPTPTRGAAPRRRRARGTAPRRPRAARARGPFRSARRRSSSETRTCSACTACNSIACRRPK